MQNIANLATLLIAGLQIYILVLEMFFWNTPRGKKAFKLSDEFAAASRVLAANQGLYNGFLSAGLLWGVWLGPDGNPIKLFFLGCVTVAGIFGAATSSKKILFAQGIPGAIGMVLTLLA